MIFFLCLQYTVPFRMIRQSRVTRPPVGDENERVSQVTGAIVESPKGLSQRENFFSCDFSACPTTLASSPSCERECTATARAPIALTSPSPSPHRPHLALVRPALVCKHERERAVRSHSCLRTSVTLAIRHQLLQSCL